MREVLRRTDRKPLTPKTLTSFEALEAEIGKVREQGYAIIDEELEIGLRSIAVPILDRSGRTVAALNTGVQTGRASRERLLSEFLPRLLQTQEVLLRALA
jgi:IclR family pca regulon transcriptional regulator